MGPLTNHDESESGLGNTLPDHRAGSPSLLTLLGPDPKAAAGFNFSCLRARFDHTMKGYVQNT
jgi:hypothetical protein